MSLFLVVLVSAQENNKETIFLKNNSDKQIIELLASTKSEDAIAASEEIFLRGGIMIPLLIELEGNDKCFYGLKGLGEWNRSGLSRSVDCLNSDSKVSVETAALFLIQAIFYEDLKFASPPLLCDFSYKTLTCGEVGNTVERKKKAWKATKKWFSLLEIQGIDYLRERNNDPFKNSGLSF